MTVVMKSIILRRKKITSEITQSLSADPPEFEIKDPCNSGNTSPIAITGRGAPQDLWLQLTRYMQHQFTDSKIQFVSSFRLLVAAVKR